MPARKRDPQAVRAQVRKSRISRVRSLAFEGVEPDAYEVRPHALEVPGVRQMARDGVLAEVDLAVIEAGLFPGAAGPELHIADCGGGRSDRAACGLSTYADDEFRPAVTAMCRSGQSAK